MANSPLYFPASFVRRIIAAVQWVERQMRSSSSQHRRSSQILPIQIRRFELYETLTGNTTATAYRVPYSGDGDTCTAADYAADTSNDTFTVGGGHMGSIRQATHAAGTRGWCVKMPGVNYWEIFQIDCDPTES